MDGTPLAYTTWLSGQPLSDCCCANRCTAIYPKVSDVGTACRVFTAKNVLYSVEFAKWHVQCHSLVVAIVENKDTLIKFLCSKFNLLQTIIPRSSRFQVNCT
ncbi:unnamed protein product [Gongylonema pulchrum]|uniref:ACT domain-containing protein n=1 Tax=Gongylonema pulchrum TaxID=637853 RepID=A0A183EIH1_9BILA|nr:unnamed protein product [Gongylonema pulchrum]